MKVEVTIIKRPSVKVEVTLAKARRRGYCVSIPVRVAQDEQPAVSPEELLEATEAEAAPADETAECESAAVSDCEDSDETDTPDTPDSADDMELTDDADEIDEDDLLALIEEEEAEMNAQLHNCEAGTSADLAEAADVFEDTLDKAAESEAFFAESESEDGGDFVSPDDNPSAEQAAGTEQFVRYFGRDTNGERFEVYGSDASGQEIVCVDGESGKLSRVCGFIRHNQPAENSEDNASSDEE